MIYIDAKCFIFSAPIKNLQIKWTRFLPIFCAINLREILVRNIAILLTNCWTSVFLSLCSRHFPFVSQKQFESVCQSCEFLTLAKKGLVNCCKVELKLYPFHLALFPAKGVFRFSTYLLKQTICTIKLPNQCAAFQLNSAIKFYNANSIKLFRGW